MARHTAWLLGSLLFAAGTARADNLDYALGASVGDGTLGSHLSHKTYMSLTYDFPMSVSWLQDLAWGFKVHGEANVARWHGCIGVNCNHVTDAGVSAVFRTTLSYSAGHSWYLDLAVGAHLISPTSIGEQVYSTGFQFSEMSGAGLLFGPRQRYEAGLRYMHESNGDIKLPNDGMNFVQLHVAVHW